MQLRIEPARPRARRERLHEQIVRNIPPSLLRWEVPSLKQVPLRAVAQDGTSGIFVPASASEYTTLLGGTGIASPDSIWLLQEASGNAADSGTAGITLTPTGTITYQSAVTGWTRTGMALTDNVQGFFGSTAAGLPDPTTTSMTVLLYAIPDVTPIANRDIMETAGTNGRIRINATPRTVAGSGSNIATGAVSPVGKVQPYLYVYNKTASAVTVYTLDDVLVPTFTAGATKGIRLGGSSGGSPPPTARMLYGAAWYGVGAEFTKTQAHTLFHKLAWVSTWAVAADETSTLGALTLSSASTVAIAGTAAITLGALTSSSASTLAVKAADASTLGALTLSSTATVALRAQAAVTLGALSSLSAAQLVVQGTAGGSLGPLAAAATGTVRIAASAGITLDALTSVSAGQLPLTANVGGHLGPLVLEATAEIAVPILGALNITLGSLTTLISGHGPVYALVDYIAGADLASYISQVDTLDANGAAAVPYYIVAGSLTPGITLQVTENGVVKNLTGYTDFVMHWQRPDGTTADVPLQVLDAVNGQLFYQWVAGDTDIAGAHAGIIDCSIAGRPQVFPNNDAARWTVNARPF
jgi:hypothetical protein